MSRKTKIIIASILISLVFIAIVLSLLSREAATPILTIPLSPSPALRRTTQSELPGQQIAQSPYTDISQAVQLPNAVESETEISKIPNLPIYIDNFSTSKGPVTINLFALPNEPSSILHLEVYGPNYSIPESTVDNPNAVMFTESFVKIRQDLVGAGVDPKKINFIYGTRQYIHTTAAAWVEAFGLLK